MSEPLRILHYTGVYAPAWSFGGPVRSVSGLCEGLARLGHRVTVFTTDAGLEQQKDIPRAQPVQLNGVTVHYFPADRDPMGLRSSMLEAAIRQRCDRFDLVHITGVWQPTSRAAWKAARGTGRPYVCSPRGALGRYSFSQKSWKKWPYFLLWERPGLAQAAALHCTSRMEEEECGRLRLGPPLFVVPNSIDVDRWKPDRHAAQAWRATHGLQDSFVLLYAGRLHHKKGLELLVDCLIQAGNQAKHWKLVLLGFDEDKTGMALKAYLARRGLGERLLLLPGTDAAGLVAAYSAADLFVFPSRHENFGNVVVEALACGCPTVVSDQVGVADLLRDIEGVSVIPRVARLWTSEILRLAGLRRPRPTDRDRITQRFSSSAVAATMADCYRRVLS